MKLRVADEDDGEAVARIYGPVVTDTAISFEVVPPSPAEMGARIANTLADYPWIVLDDDQLLAGYAYANRYAERAAYAWSVETSVYVHPDRRGIGVGRMLYAALGAILQQQGFRRAVAGATLPNPASVALHEAVGLRQVGVYHDIGWKHGSWHDVVVWELDLRPGDHAPSDPTPFSELPPALLDAIFTGALTRST